MKKYLLLIPIILLAACNDKVKPNEAAKSIKPSYAVMLDSQSYTSGDVDLLNNIKAGDARRVRAILQAGTATPYSADDTDTTGLALAAQLKNQEIAEAILDKTTAGDEKVLNRGDKTGKTPMIYAAEAGAAEIISLLRKKGANPNIYDSAQNFALLVAARKNDLPSVKALLHDYGDSTPTNADIADASGETAIIAATKNKNRGIIEALKEYGANINSSNEEGVTPLIEAAILKDKPLFDYLLEQGADMNAYGVTKRTPLIYVLENNNYDFAKYLLDKGADANKHYEGYPSPLQVAVAKDNADANMVTLLISKGAKLSDPSIPLGNVISRSIHKGNAAAITVLLANHAKVADLETPTSNGIIQALNIDDPELALLMIANGANIAKMDESSFSPLAIAAKKGYTNVFEALVKAGADVNQTSRNKTAIPIEIVMDNDNADILEIMFNNGLKASPDAVLLRAIGAKTDKVIPIAIKHGARPNIMNTTGQPILWLAIAKDDNVAAKFLIDNGALLDVQDSGKGISPLSLAIARGNAEIANYLIEKNANPDIVDNNGFSSLAYAAASGQAEIAKNLIAHKAEVNAVDKSGNSILNLVELSKLPKDKKDEMSKILKAAGAT